MLLNFKIKHWEWSVLVVASINFSNKGRTRSSNGHHRKHSSTPLLFSPESKGNTRWPKYKPTAFSLPYQTCLLRYKPKLASCHGCHWSFEIMIKWSYESFWSQYYMFFRRKFCSWILRDSFVMSATLKKKELLSRLIKTLFGRSADTAKIE